MATLRHLAHLSRQKIWAPITNGTVAILFFLTLPTAAQAQSIPQTTALRAPGLTLTTPAFQDGGIIPNKYTRAAEGHAVSPGLTWTNVPMGTVTFALLVRDPDSSIARTTKQIVHWMIFNIPGTTRELPEATGSLACLNDGSVQALNHNKEIGYMGMAAAAAGPYHHYTFELFALDMKLSLGPNATQTQLLKQVDGHILMKGVLVGRFHLP